MLCLLFFNYILRAEYLKHNTFVMGSMQVILLAFSLYFFLIEVYQLKKQGPNVYFVEGGLWNFLDLGPPILITANFVFSNMGIYKWRTDLNGRELEAIIRATISLFMWLKFLYFLRIFKSTGYLTRIIRDVIFQMRHFLMLLILTIVAFSDSLNQISSSSKKGHEPIKGGFLGAFDYTYQTILGNINDDFTKGVAVGYSYFIFYLLTLFCMIIMMNLLIAIISQTFSDVNEVSV